MTEPRRVVLLAGPPGAGKTTAAHSSGLTVFDRDDQYWDDDSHFQAALNEIARDTTARAVVIRSGATATARARTATQIAATHTYVVLAEPAELKRRIRLRRRADLSQTIRGVDRWFERFDRDDDVEEFPGWNLVHDVEYDTEIWAAS